MSKILFVIAFLYAAEVLGQGTPPRMETNLDQVYSMYNLSGKGVAVVILDRGIDYRHTDFIQPNGNTRIAYIFDMLDNTGANQEFWGATSNKRELMIDLSGAAGTYKIHLEGSQVSSTGEFTATLNPSTHYNNNAFTSHVVAGHSINDYATSQFGLTPTDYVVKNEWTDINGIARDITGQGESGELWIGSSEGPTHDNRRGVDFATPGEVCFAAYRPDTWYANFPHNIIQGSNSKYGIQNAVSAAAPLSMGIIALMLEVNPDLTPAEVRSILEQSCRSDTFTGTVPNPTWGYGKLDALQAIQNTYATVGLDINDPVSFSLFPNPGSDVLRIELQKGSEQVAEISILNMQGQVIRKAVLTGPAITVDMSAIPSGIYLIRLEQETGTVIQKLIKR